MLIRIKKNRNVHTYKIQRRSKKETTLSCDPAPGDRLLTDYYLFPTVLSKLPMRMTPTPNVVCLLPTLKVVTWLPVIPKSSSGSTRQILAQDVE